MEIPPASDLVVPDGPPGDPSSVLLRGVHREIDDAPHPDASTAGRVLAGGAEGREQVRVAHPGED